MHPFAQKPEHSYERKPWRDQSEKKVYVDPLSLKLMTEIDADQPLMIPIVPTGIEDTMRSPHAPLPPSQMRKPKYVSASLPGSAMASPRYEGPQHYASRAGERKTSIIRRSAFAGGQNSLGHVSDIGSFSRSKSCGEGRSSAPADDLDILTRRTVTLRLGSSAPLIDDNKTDSTNYHEESQGRPSVDTHMKCGVLCLSLPGISKKKPAKLSKLSSPVTYYRPTEAATRASLVSRGASLERFECSTTSSGFIIEEGSSYFDLPMEMIKWCNDEIGSPVNAAFLFDGEGRKGTLKKSMSSPRLAPGMKDSSSSSSSSSKDRDLLMSGGKAVRISMASESTLSSACTSP